MTSVSNSLQEFVYSLSRDHPAEFWSHHASSLHWHKPYSKVYSEHKKSLSNGKSHPTWSWFPGGKINTTYNCVDRHVQNGRGKEVAIIWDSPVAGCKQKITYEELLREVEVLAGVMREEGEVVKGDVVLIYMPMIPQALFAMLAAARLGALHAVVFGGFASGSLAQRIDAARPKIIMTASCAIEGTKGPLDYRQFIEGALKQSSYKPHRTFIWQREQHRWNPLVEYKGQRDWQRLVESAKARGVKAECVPVDSNDGLYIIYTSGTTGLPKGVLRLTAGHLVGLSLSIRSLFNITGPGSTIFTASDIGWVVGHSYIVYAPLLVGAATVVYEGKPVGTPNAGAFWRAIEEHKVDVLFTAPTALRAIRKEDPEGTHLRKVGKRGGLKSLKALFLAGERSEPSIIQQFQNLLSKYAAKDALVIDHWWSSESGSPITGILLRPDLALVPNRKQPSPSASLSARPLKIKPGSAGLALPGFHVEVVDDSGSRLSRGKMGNIVLGIPLGPTAFTTLFNDPVRFYNGYMKRFDGRWIDTGDAGMVDQDGYVHIMSRSDDVINVAAHRFSTGSLEQTLLLHPSITEACVVSIPDPLKGHLPFAFISVSPSSTTTSTSSTPTTAHPTPDLLNSLNALLRTNIGPIATLGGAIQGSGIVPRTRSGKTLRRVLRALLEAELELAGARSDDDGGGGGGGGGGGSDKEQKAKVDIPPTIEDAEVVERARERIRMWIEERQEKGGGAKL